VNQQIRQDSEAAKRSEVQQLPHLVCGEQGRNSAVPNHADACDRLYVLLSQAVPLRGEMEERLDRLKEAFLETLSGLLQQEGIDLKDRLLIGFHGGVLRVADLQHPQAARINALLDRTPILAGLLRRIAMDTLLLHGLDVLDQAVSLEQQNIAREGMLETYQVCLKGSLSHFYYA
jgi:hypothetical protein